MKKKVTYKTKEGKVLYGFSQTSLDKTNAKLDGVIFGLKVLIVLLIIFLLVVFALGWWVASNDVITRIIYGY